MIGLIFGENNFPKKILIKLKKLKKKYLIIDLTKNKNYKKEKNSHAVSIGQIGKIIKIFKTQNCNRVIFAGNVKKPNFSKIKLDFKGVYYIPRIIKASNRGDAAILKELIKILNENTIKVIKSNFFNPELTLLKGNYSKIKPNKSDLSNIQKGTKVLKNLNAHNHVQGLVIKDNVIIKMERSKGTKEMLQSINKTKDTGGILIKLPKKKQDLRVDLPTIGLDTFRDCKRANLKGIVLKSNQNIFMDKKKCISFANKNKIFISIV
jgi:DUF1009 family protein